MHAHRSAALTLLPLAALGATLATPVTALARDFQVTTTRDLYDGLCNAHCSLRDAVDTANHEPGPHRIFLPAGTYTFSLPAPTSQDGEILDEDNNLNGDLDIGTTLSVIGAGAETTIIDAARLDRVFEVLAGAELTLQHLTVRNGHSNNGGGGGIQNHGVTTTRHVVIEKNGSENPGVVSPGGGVANFGRFNLYSSVVRENGCGGMSNAHGGGIFNADGGTLAVRDSTIIDNSVGDEAETAAGGGIYNIGTADIARSAFISNNAQKGGGGAISNLGTLMLSNSTLSENVTYDPSYEGRGNGAFINGRPSPTMTAVPEATLVHVTIANNIGGGVRNYGRLVLRNGLIAGNFDSSHDDPPLPGKNCINLEGATFLVRGLLLGTGEGNCTAEQYIDNALTFSKVLLPLADNNGITQTHGLRQGSPALDAAIGSCSNHDQRGLTRPRDGDGDGVAVCDLGAFERARP
ncbi:CSLREA domain-containing protein [Pseudomonas indica]|uniref:CSLREA domain-containing protein n=1 Tax=Pseudomonas indica TaxID=137658 RepID=A0A1G9JSI2_9PSED|nr:CSLREA domain-containing protein [Pseudomonas indica]SDL40498.1 CSLREA domain-containing protein [Pseudomonas indica]